MPNELPINVLLVEDKPGDAILICRMLSNFDVARASSLSEAVEAINKASFNVIVLDLNLGDSMGLEP